MEKQIKTIKDATYEWVRGFNAIPQNLLERAFNIENGDGLRELTLPSVSDTVNVYSDEYKGSAIVKNIDNENNLVTIETDDDEVIDVSIHDVEMEYYGSLPMWGTLWTFEESIDENWCLNNLDIVSSCGFRIYQDDSTDDIYIGIDGAGYDFYEAHWIPLYKARGLQWHDVEQAS